MRLVSDDPDVTYLPGSTVLGLQDSSTVPLHVTQCCYFASAGEAFSCYAARGEHQLLFPAGWDGWSPSSPTQPSAIEAELYFQRLHHKTPDEWLQPGARAVRVLTLAPQPGSLGPPLPPSPNGNEPATHIPEPTTRRPPHNDRRHPQRPLPRRATRRTRRDAPCSPRRGLADPRPPPPLPTSSPQSPDSSLPPYLPLTAAAVTAARSAVIDLEAPLVERIVSDARYAARSRGASDVTARDIANAAAAHAGSASALSDPAAEIPEHYDEVVERLSRLCSNASSSFGGELGLRKPRVLVVGETHGVVASMFLTAGADAATCDLKGTDTPHIPHFQGDASSIMDLGWDLVIAHPPCTYLANSGVTWLHRDAERWQHVLHNADVFRRMYNARAPFVAVENSKMHRYARDLVGVRPTQYVHPWQHGTGHTKPTGLFLRNLPELTPTKPVSGREHALARLPPSPDRSARRSRTYLGIAAAMALQWMPTLLEYTSTLDTDDRPTAADLVERAGSPQEVHLQIAFTRRPTHSSSHPEVLTYGDDSTLLTVPLPEGTSVVSCGREWMDRTALLPSLWRDAVAHALNAFESGHSQYTCYSPPSRTHPARLKRFHLFVIDVSHLDRSAAYLSRSASLPSYKYGWSPLSSTRAFPRSRPADDCFMCDTIADHLRSPPDPSSRPPTFPGAGDDPPPRADRSRAAAVIPNDSPSTPASSAPSWPATRYPWLSTKTDARPPAPAPRHVRYIHGKWRAWTAGDLAEGSPRPFQWQCLPPDLSSQLEAHLQPRRALPPIPEIDPHLREYHSSVLTAAAAVPSARAHQDYLLDSLRNLWDRSERAISRDSRFPYAGLGFDPKDPACDATTSGRSSPRQPRRSASWYRDAHQRWVSPEKVSQRVAAAQRPADTQTSSSPDGPPPTDTKTEVAAEEVALPSSSRPHAHSLYLTDLRFARRRGSDLSSKRLACAVVSPTSCLADTGAGPSLVTTSALEQIPRECCTRHPDAPVSPIDGPNGQPLRTSGTATLTFALNGQLYEHLFVVVVGTPLLLLGNDFLDSHRAIIRLNEDGQGSSSIELHSVSKKDGRRITHTVTATSQPAAPRMACFVDSSVSEPGGSPDDAPTPEPVAGAGVTEPSAISVEPLPAAQLVDSALLDGCWKLTTSEHILYSQHPIPLAKRSITKVFVRAPQALHGASATCFVDQLPHRSGLDAPVHVIPRVARIEDGYIEVHILNTRRHHTTIPASAPLALLDSEYFVHGNLATAAGNSPVHGGDYYAALDPEQQAIVDKVEIDPDKRLSPAQRELARQLVAKHVTAFAIDPKAPSKTHLLEVELPLQPGATPHRHAASKLGEEGRLIVEKHVEEMESRGIIRKSNSAWGSRVVLVSKKDGTIRFCVDYRDLNSKLKLLDSPLPLTVEAIDRLSSGKGSQASLFLSTLDLASGFWCLPIREQDKPLTAFVTHRQKYEFNYLPFGVQSGPSYMCRLMDAALQGLAWDTCMPYLDDVGIWSTGVGDTAEACELNSFEQMMQRLEAVFERLKWAGLSMKASKCCLFATKAEYLGHIIGREGLRMDPKKIAAVAAVDTKGINTVERVRSFLGLCSYYRRFIQGFSKIAAPLHDLTKDGVDVAERSQSDECQSALRQLISSITSEPVLATPRYDRQFIVKTDAANTEGLGGVLSQKDDDGRERVIAYHGRKLTKHERNYTVTEIELLAAIESIKAWRPYLWGREFKLVIDHVALRWLHTMRDTMEGGPASRLMRWILKLQEYRFTVEHKPGLIHKDADGVSRLVSAVTSSVARTAVTTARGLQRQQRERVARDRPGIVRSYLDPGGPSLDTLRDEQGGDPMCVAIISYLERGHAGDVLDSNELRAATRLAAEVCPNRRGQPRNRFFVGADGLLYRRAPAAPVPPSQDPSETAVLVIPESLRHELLTAFHDHAGHRHADAIYALLRERYYWPNMLRDAKEHVAECHECTLAKGGNRRHRHPVGSSLGSYPFDVLYTDILSMAATHDYDKDSGTGATKLIIFVDSLSRWVEAIPLHSDPTSEQVLDIFMTHVVSRHGVPRRIVSDNGSNLADRLCSSILGATGVNLSPTAAEHHEGVGVVERFNGTLVQMARASDEGGAHWVDHLPFLLLSYRASPNRVTKASPAMLVYGRELRLPAQLQGTDADSSDPLESADVPPHALDLTTQQETEATDAHFQYGCLLHNRLVYAWQAARDLTLAHQGASIADTVQRASPPLVFQVNDRVARRLPDRANKLSYVYAGPYRVDAVLGDGRYRLTDLENNHIVKEFDVSNLRPYRTHVDAEELQSDEYLVDRLVNHRGVGNRRQYRVKWRGYPLSQSTWEPRAELERRCADLVDAYESSLPIARRAVRIPVAPSAQAAASPGPSAPSAPMTATVDPHADPAAAYSTLPHLARFERGRWLYGKTVPTPRGPRLRLLESRNYTPAELASEHFSSLRRLAASVLCDSSESVDFLLARDPSFSPRAPSTEPAPESEVEHASKVWFARTQLPSKQLQLLCAIRADSAQDKPQYDTFGGRMSTKDDNQYQRCALREVLAEMKLPPKWKEPLSLALVSDPDGQQTIDLHRRTTGQRYRQAMWIIVLDHDIAHLPVSLSNDGLREFNSDSLRWRPATAVVENLLTFETFAPVGASLRELLVTHEDGP